MPAQLQEYKMFGDKKYRWIMSRRTKEQALEIKKRLTRIGTIGVRIQKTNYTHVGAVQHYKIYARPEKALTWDRLHQAMMRLL